MSSLQHHETNMDDLRHRLILVHPRRNQMGRKINIVAIHGLDARSPKTWTFIEKNGKSTNWLKDILPNDFESANVYTYDWQAEFRENSLQESLRDHAKRFLSLILPPSALAPSTSKDEWVPIIFIASCFGGLLLAETICQADSEREASFLRAIFGIAFLGTPFGGTAAARVARWAADISYSSGRLASRRLVDLLKPGNDTLERLQESFTSIAKIILLPTFYFCESQETYLLKKFLPAFLVPWVHKFPPCLSQRMLLVDRNSASLNPSEIVMLAVPHVCLNKFKDKDSTPYQQIKEKIAKFERDISYLRAKRQEDPSGILQIIPPENCRFVGRAKFVEDIFVSIRDKSSGDKDAVTTIFGLEGVGKTEVALKIAHRLCQQKDDYGNLSWSVFWVSASTPESLHENYRTIARYLDSNLDADTLSNGDLRKHVNQNLKGKTKNWLFVFDDAREWLRREDLPHALLGSVLITTDDRRVADSLGSRSDLPLLERQDAIDLFEEPFNFKRQSKDNIDIDRDKKDIEKLVGTCLMFHPLAIKLASDYIARQGRRHGIKEYVDNWELSRAPAFGGNRSDEINNWSIEIIVKQVFKTSLGQVISEDRSTLPILGMIASFDKTNIPVLLLRGVQDENGRLVDLDKVLDILISYSFIAWHQESEVEGNSTKPTSIDVHELVQRAMEDRFKAQGIYSQQLIADVISVAKQVSMPSPQDERRKLRSIVPHVESVLRKAEKACQNPGNTARLSQIFIYGGPGWHLYYVVGQMHLLLGEQQKAERHHQKALHLELRDVANTFLKVSTEEAKLIGVEPKKQNLEMSKTGEMGPRELLSTISEKLSLASALVNKASYQAAQDLFQEASDNSQAKLGITHPLTISALSYLGQTQSLRGDFKAAAATFEKVLDSQKAALPRGCEGPLRIYKAIFSTLETLTFVYQSDGNYQMVQERLEQARKVQTDYINDDSAIQWCEEHLKLILEQQRPLSPAD